MGTSGTRIATALLGLAAVVESVLRQRGTGETAPYVLLVCLLGLATTVPVMLRYASVAAVVVTTAGVLSLSVFHMLTFAGIAAHMFAFYRLGRHGWLPVSVVLSVPYPTVALANPSLITPVLLTALVQLAMLGGIADRTVRESAVTRAARDVHAGTLMEHTARGERARIARELHDIVAHHISMIAVLAETTRLTTPGMPDQGARGLRQIGDTARASLTEMRRLLGVLRGDAQDDGDETTVRQPQPGLRQLNDLLDTARDVAGASTRMILRGTPTVLDPGVELAAFRIVQEALTNARRHAPRAAVDVELHYTPTALRLVIRDNGPGPATPPPPDVRQARFGQRLAILRRRGGPGDGAGISAPTSGAAAAAPPDGGKTTAPRGKTTAPRGNGTAPRGKSTALRDKATALATTAMWRRPSDGSAEPTTGLGLVGMRERAAAVGGELRTGPASMGGFLIEATFPVDAQDFR